MMKFVKKGLIIFFVFLFGIVNAQNGILSNYTFDENKIKQIVLSSELNEISGLALSKNRLFCHNDEYAIIYEIDTNNGEIIKSFNLGSGILKGDFEDLVIMDNDFYLVESNGTIYKFCEGKKNQGVDYQIIKTELKTKNDVEGIQFSINKKNLLLLCKESAGKKLKGYRAIYELDLKSKKLNLTPKYLIKTKKVKAKTGRKNFNPSAIKLTHKKTFLILDGKGKSIVEINLDGEIINAIPLNKKIHHQPEGIEILNNGTIIISDEAGKGKPTLTFYPINKFKDEK